MSLVQFPENEPVQDRYINAATVREICGGISDMSLFRWLKDEELNFPRPAVIQRNRYWREAEVRAWMADRQEQ